MQNAGNIQKLLLEIFIRRVLDRNIPAGVALDFGNTYSLRSLQGAAHYVYLMETTKEDGGEAAFEVIKFGQGIDEALKVRLLHGYWSLMRTCLRLRSTPPIDLTTCQTLGIAEWHQSYNIPFHASSPDLLGLLQEISQSLRVWCGKHRKWPPTNSGWLNRVLSQLEQEIQRVQENLMNHFDHHC